MDTNNDGIVDDPLATKKRPGRKSLGLTPEEMKARKAAQRKIREYNKRYKKRQQDIALLVATIFTLADKNMAGDEIVDKIVKSKAWDISFNPNALQISGTSGERIRRR